MTRRTFRFAFTAIVAASWLLRLAYVRFVKWNDEVVGDELHYFAQAATIARGDWFQDPWFPGYSALHAPLTALALAPVSWVDQNLIVTQRLLMTVYGTAVVAGIGLLARLLFDRRIALAATAIAGLYANLWVSDGILMSEPLAAAGTVGVMISAYLYYRRRDALLAALMGLTVGLAGLARAELLLLGVMLVLPITLLGSRGTAARRVGHLALAGLVAVALVSPWVIRNQIRFDEPAFMSTQDGLTLLGANCPEAYEGPAIGFWVIGCALRVDVPEGVDESVKSKLYREEAIEFVGDNLDRLPVVAVARLGRGLSLWDVETMVFFNQGEGRHPWTSRLGLWQYWLLVPLAGYGLWRWPSRLPRWPLVTTAALSLVVIVTLYGIPRFRLTAEIGIVVCAAVALVDLWERLMESRRTRRTGSSATPGPRPTAQV